MNSISLLYIAKYRTNNVAIKVTLPVKICLLSFDKTFEIQHFPKCFWPIKVKSAFDVFDRKDWSIK